MDIEQRLTTLEARLRKAEDQLEIIALINSYDARTITGQSINVDAGGVMVG